MEFCFGIAGFPKLPLSASLTSPSKRGTKPASLFEGGGTPQGVTEGVCRKKSRPFHSEAGGTICRAKTARLLSVSLILRRLNGTASNAGFLARFVARVLCLPGLPSGLLSKSRSPYSCGTAQASHLFFRNRGALSYAQKAGGRAPSLALTDFFHIISE